MLLAEKSGKPKDIQWCIANDTKGYPIVVISNKPDKEGHVWVLRERDQEYFLDCQRIWELTFSGARMKPVEENVESDQRGTGDK